jgi:hypothetical protein
MSPQCTRLDCRDSVTTKIPTFNEALSTGKYPNWVLRYPIWVPHAWPLDPSLLANDAEIEWIGNQ